MKPYYEQDGITIYHGDCRDVLPTLSLCGGVSLLLTDPPYGINVDTGWLTSLHVQRGKPANKSDAKVIGDDKKPDISHLFEFPKRLIFGHPYLQDPYATGWLVWDKNPGLDGRTMGSPVEVACTTLWTGWDVVRCLWAGYYREPGEVRYEHPTQKPMKPFLRLIGKYSKPGELILDPYMGSGTVLEAAKRLGRRAIGCELEERYCEIAVKRLAQSVLPLEVPA